MELPPKPRTPYLLPKEQDKIIMEKLSRFDNKELSREDEELIKLFYSQLETDWRTPLEESIDELLKKYGHKNNL